MRAAIHNNENGRAIRLRIGAPLGTEDFALPNVVNIRGESIKRLREQAGLTQSQLAKALGLPHYQAVQKLESGCRKACCPDSLYTAAETLLQKLLAWEDYRRLTQMRCGTLREDGEGCGEGYTLPAAPPARPKVTSLVAWVEHGRRLREAREAKDRAQASMEDLRATLRRFSQL